MSQPRDPALAIAPERYEFDEAPRYRADLGRRGFLGVLTAMGGGLLVVASEADGQQESGRGRGSDATSNELASWIHIDTKGHVTGFTGKVEIGQNIRTSLAQAIADELHVPLDAVSMVMADTALTPFDMGTFGSRTTPTMAPVLAKAAASAREQLVARAAAKWQVQPATLQVERGIVQASDGRHVSYGDLIAAGDLSGVISADMQVAPKARWEIRGTAAKKVNGREVVTGGHPFTPDLTRPGMLHGRIIRPSAYGATRVAVDDAAARGIDGVKVVVEDDLVAVLAPNERMLQRAVAAMRVTWTDAPAQPDSKSIYEHLKRTAQPGGGGGRGGGNVRGDVDAAVASASTVLRESYLIPYIAHVPLEPRAAVAEWRADGGVTIWTGTQRPFGVRTEVADAFRLAEDRVRVIVPDMGSAYGGKHTGEQAIEAARLAKAAGRPVKIVYTRQEEFMWGYFRPAGVIDVAAALDKDGRLVSWEFRNYNSGASGIQTPYSVPNQRVVFHDADSPLRQGSYRGLAATANHYAREMHMDALARHSSVDPVTFRRNHLAEPRLRAVLDAVASKSGWPAVAGRALGIACGTEKGSYVATTAEVARSAGGFEVVRLIVAFECGAIVNPDGLRNQVEGSIVQGLGGALFEAVAFAGGRLQNGSMAQYRVPRFKDVPPIDIILLDRPDLPSAGAGETPIVCVAPAIGSAVRAFGEVEPALPVRLKA